MDGDRRCRLHRLARGAGLRGGRARRRRRRRPVQRAPRVRARRGAVRRGHHRRHRPDGRARCASTTSRASCTSRASSTPGSRSTGRCTPTTQNVTGTVNLLEAMERTGVDKIVFSSSAATFGTPDVDLVTEETATRPESPYGESKLIGEWLLRDQGRARRACGTPRCATSTWSARAPTTSTTPARTTCSRSSSRCCSPGETPRINGDDYATPDGTCVRDYVHVGDLAALARRRGPAARGRRRARSPSTTSAAATGCSVAEIMDAIRDGHRASTSRPRSARVDPVTRPASWPPARLAARDLDWQMRHDLEDMVRSAWQARSHAG